MPASETEAVFDKALVVMAHFVYAGRVGGAEHMLYNLLRGFDEVAATVRVVCGSRGNLDPRTVAELDRMPQTQVLEAGGGGPRFLAEQRACLDRSLRGEAVLFPNYFLPPVVPRRLGRTAVVLHDLQYRHFPEHFAPKKRAWLRLAQGLAMHRADRVITLSEFVAGDAVRRFGAGLARKLAVVPNPISWERFAGGVSQPSPLDRPYVLTVAAQYPHKNLETLLRGFAQVAAKDRDTMLVLCGQDYGGLRGVAAGRGGIRPVLEALGLTQRVIITGYLDDATLGRWYRHAALFAFPSVFEGFGMPAVEALGFGLPVLTTRCTALPESTLGLASYVNDPYRSEEWAARIAAILADPDAARPTAQDVRRLKDHYHTARIARLYLQACGL
jgi:glycosyltransferase involved in cell wall biosynthesis